MLHLVVTEFNLHSNLALVPLFICHLSWPHKVSQGHLHNFRTVNRKLGLPFRATESSAQVNSKRSRLIRVRCPRNFSIFVFLFLFSFFIVIKTWILIIFSHAFCPSSFFSEYCLSTHYQRRRLAAWNLSSLLVSKNSSRLTKKSVQNSV